jgi:hypothetical protein
MQVNGKPLTLKFGFKAAQALQQEAGVAIPQIIQAIVSLDFETIKTTFRHACGQENSDALLEAAVDEHGLKPVMEAIAMALAMFLDPQKASEIVDSPARQKKAAGSRPKA